MSNNITQARYHKRTTFQQLSPPLVLTKPQGAFFPWAKKTTTRDAGNISIGEHAKQRKALDPARLQPILAMMRDVGDRIARLEARRAAPQPAPTHDAPTNPLARTLVTGATPNGGAVLIGADGRETFINPTHRNTRGAPDTFEITPTRDAPFRLFPKTKAKDAAMPTPRHPGLAPNRFITTHADQRGFNDAAYGTQFGERNSRFTSAEADRLARHAPVASLPSPAELNATYRAAHAGVGASGQSHDTTQPGKTQQRTSGVNRRGGMLEALPSDSSEGFASELNKVPAGSPPNTALNLYYGALAKAKTPAARDAIDKTWSAFQRR